MKCTQYGNELEGEFCSTCDKVSENVANQQQDNNGSNIKKPFYKKWRFIVFMLIVILCILVSIGDSKEFNNNLRVKKTTVTEKTDKTITEEKTKTESNIITVDTSVLGEYGKELMYKVIDDDFNIVKKTEIGFFVPAGKYNITLVSGDDFTQITVFSGKYNVQEDKNGNVYEEVADIFDSTILFRGENSKEIEVPNGYCFVTNDNSNCILELEKTK